MLKASIKRVVFIFHLRRLYNYRSILIASGLRCKRVLSLDSWVGTANMRARLGEDEEIITHSLLIFSGTSVVPNRSGSITSSPTERAGANQNFSSKSPPSKPKATRSCKQNLDSYAARPSLFLREPAVYSMSRVNSTEQRMERKPPGYATLRVGMWS